jgi:predicted transcriptional regulator
MIEKTISDSVQDEMLLECTTKIAASYLEHNELPISEIPTLISTVYQSLLSFDGHEAASPDHPEPAVPVKKSVFPDYIICLEDGKKLKMLKRHLKTAYNMTPEQYRARWALGLDYPLVAPNYARQRSRLAKQIGLGTGRKKK